MGMNGDFLSASHTRRLPVYLLLDCSGSMTGDPITAVNEGLGIIYTELMKDPQAVQTVHISLIRFSDRADQDPLVPIDQFIPPQLSAYGATAMGAALSILADSIEQDLVLNIPDRNQHGDYCPLVFLLTDGAPTDEYRTSLSRIKALRGSRRPTIVALGCGSGVNVNMLHEVTENVFLMQAVSVETLKKFFKWLSGSVTSASRTAAGGAPTQLASPTTIPGITYSPS